jgi:hypothetical protein
MIVLYSPNGRIAIRLYNDSIVISDLKGIYEDNGETMAYSYFDSLLISIEEYSRFPGVYLFHRPGLYPHIIVDLDKNRVQYGGDESFIENLSYLRKLFQEN